MEEILKDHVSATEAAALLGVSRPTITTWVSQGRMPGAKRVGVFLRIPRSDVEALIKPAFKEVAK